MSHVTWTVASPAAVMWLRRIRSCSQSSFEEWLARPSASTITCASSSLKSARATKVPSLAVNDVLLDERQTGALQQPPHHGLKLGR
jgi:hypothetical protein